MEFVRIIGTGRSVPSNIVTNDDLKNIVDTNDEWISSRTGIKERRISKGKNNSYYAAKAAKEAIKKANIDPLDIDIIIVATNTPDNGTPSTGCMVQDIIGAKNAHAFDMSAACTGFIYGINIGTKMLLAGEEKTALVIGSEILSRSLDWTDRGTCVLFGDGAGACILQKGSERGIIDTFVASDGTKGRDVLYCARNNVESPFSKENEKVKPYLTMEGREIFKFAVRIMPYSVNRVLQKNNTSLDEIKYIIPHQANLRIVEAAAKKLELPIEKFYINVDKYGNTSAASIAIALDEMMEKKLLSKGDKIVLVGFGGGLTYGAVLLEI